jgi:hypothetical protein
MMATEGVAPYVPGKVLNDEQARYVSGFLSTEIKDVRDGAERDVFLQKVQKWRRMARVIPEQSEKTYPWQKASNVVTPIMAQKVNVVYAKLIAMFSSKRPFWDVQSDDYELLAVDNAVARYMNYLASAPFHLNIDSVNRTMFYDLVLLGTQMVKVPWLYEEWQLKTDQGSVNRVMHNGPAIVPVRIEDFLIRSYYDDVQRAPWVGNLVWLTEAELRQREAMGIYEDIESVLSVYTQELQQNLRDELERRGLSSTVQNSYSETRLFPIFEGYVFYDADGDGVPEDIKIWMEPQTGTILRSENNLLGVRDLVAMSYFKVPRQLYGMGIGHLLEGLQEEADFVHNHRADNLHFSLLPMFKRRRGSMAVKKDEIHPGKFIDLDDINDLQPFVVPDLTGSTYQAEMLVRDYADRVSGANDPMSGYGDATMKSGGDTSAMTFLAQQGSSILNAIYEGIEHNYGEIGQLILLQLVANKDKVDLSVLSQQDAALVQQVLELPIESLPTTFRFKVKTTDLNRTEEAKTAQLKEATGLFMSYGQQMTQVLMTMANPRVPPVVGQFMQQLFVGGTNFVKQVMKAYKIEGVDEMFPNVGGTNAGQGGGAGSGLGDGAGNAPVSDAGMAPAGGVALEGASSAGTGGAGSTG